MKASPPHITSQYIAFIPSQGISIKSNNLVVHSMGPESQDAMVETKWEVEDSRYKKTTHVLINGHSLCISNTLTVDPLMIG